MSNPTPHLSLYILRSPRTRTEVLIAATSEEHAKSFPPFSNWRTLLKFGSWSPDENARAKVRLIGLAAEGVEAGPLMFASL